MPKVRDFFVSDLDTLINPDEFGEIHTIGNRQLSVVVDNDRLQSRSKKEYDGIYVGDLLFFVKASDFGPPPKPDSVLFFDGKPFMVFDCRPDNGLYEIILKINAS